ncbi:NEAT domain-containing protein [Peptoniphilus indolicus]|uniref:NEAT domain-containing protein n=1 Tax=Peptoniphilus indolicus TaxID=33030 RepID=A0A379DEL7_9FIRM|nr:NEAT domain-containing protein [Peptoniphilus indolicus]SUB76357.1 Uncharacterised protein [Peptoniphilus indolicus]
MIKKNVCFLISFIFIIVNLNFIQAKSLSEECDEKIEFQSELNEKSSEKEFIKLENGIYKVPIKLMHAVEDKLSMGNVALNQTGELLVENGQAYLFINVNKIQIQNITAGLVNLYYLDEKNYISAEANDYSIQVDESLERRPSVFKISIKKYSYDLEVLVDPKVEPMGDKPIKARLHIDLDKIKKIDLKESEIIEKFNTGIKKPLFNSNLAGKKIDKSFILEFRENTFDEDFNFYANKLTSDRSEEINKLFSPLDIVEIYKLETLGNLEEIPYGREDIQSLRKNILPKGIMNIGIPVKSIKPEDNPNIYQIKDGIKVNLNYSIKDGCFFIESDSLGEFVVVKEEKVDKLNKIGDFKKNEIKKKSSKSMPIKKTKKRSEFKNENSSSKNIPINTSSKINNVQEKVSSVDAVSFRNINNQEARENGLVIFLIGVLVIFINVVSIIILSRNYKIILEEFQENSRLRARKK